VPAISLSCDRQIPRGDSTAVRASSPDDTKPESPFEREVVKRLAEAGFRASLRVSVGHFCIDMVVEGDERKRLAVACDGDRYRSLESLAEDTARQAILERLGWQFVRIRGSAFYRDPDAALQRVFDRLREMGIKPTKEVDVPEEAVTIGKSLLEELEGLRAGALAAPLVPADTGAGARLALPSPAPKPRRFKRSS